MTELTISLETGSDRPLYEQIYNHIKTEILVIAMILPMVLSYLE